MTVPRHFGQTPSLIASPPLAERPNLRPPPEAAPMVHKPTKRRRPLHQRVRPHAHEAGAPRGSPPLIPADRGDPREALSASPILSEPAESSRNQTGPHFLRGSSAGLR